MSDFESLDNEGTIAVLEKHQFDVKSLEDYMKKNVPGFSGELIVEEFAGGQSNPTYSLEANGQKYVLRRKPPGTLLKSAHAVDREYRVLTALQDTNVPTAKTYCLCEDESVIGTMFYIMEYLDGRVVWDSTSSEFTPAERGAMWDAANDAVAKLHNVDFESVGLSEFGKHSNYIERQLTRWAGQYEYTKTVENPYMDNLIDYLPKNMPNEDACSIVHGDLQIANMMMHKDKPEVIGILDWELSTLGNPLSDFAYLCRPYRDGLRNMDLKQLGIPSEQEYVKHIVVALVEMASRIGTTIWPLICSGWLRFCKVLQNVCWMVRQPVSRRKLPVLVRSIWRKLRGHKSTKALTWMRTR